MSFLNNILPWRRRKIEAVKRVLDPSPKLGPLSVESLEVLLVAIAGLRDERGLRVQLDPREVLSRHFIEQNFVPVARSAWHGPRITRLYITWPQHKKTRP
jgi:hypothetical protein